MTQAGDDWEGAAQAWAEWWPLIERSSAVVVERMLALAGPRDGDCVLDVATGVGEPALSAARRVAPSGQVVATDISPSMVDFGRRRAAELGISNVEFRVMEADRLAFPEASFDLILSRWGLMFVEDLDQVLASFARLLRPGGRLAAAVWAEAREVPMISFPVAILQDHLRLPPPAEDRSTPFDLADQAALAERLIAAGFVAPKSEAVTLAAKFETPDVYLRFRREVAHPDPRMADFTAAEIEAAWQRVKGELGQFSDPGGGLTMENLTYCVAAQRP